ncbi:thioredoxin family protein [Myxococcota bacterium]|nr:thioredoxin family protein [Myxococcota bacterium]
MTKNKKSIESLEDLQALIQEEAGIIIHFETESCNVCKALKIKVGKILEDRFPRLKMISIDMEHQPEISAQMSVFSVPALVVFFDGKEFFRKGRNLGMDEFAQELSRPYSILFDE